MRKDLDDQLVSSFPLLYRDRHGDPRTTNMCFGFPDDGWFDLIYRLSAKLESLIAALPEEERGYYRATQVKAGGSLRGRGWLYTACDNHTHGS